MTRLLVLALAVVFALALAAMTAVELSEAPLTVGGLALAILAGLIVVLIGVGIVGALAGSRRG